mmetsp:Transcript_13383/g.24779  ORF Transcript_13383/g.24779 Transcript_13383/m.24779 type:complete len:324 (-) Transcript_13383:2074-3045(-)
MNEGKLQLLLVHASGDAGVVDGATLAKACKMYLEVDEEAEVAGLEAACNKILNGETIKPEACVAAIKEERGKDLTAIFAAAAAREEAAAAEEKVPASSSSLGTLLNANLDEEDDDDDDEADVGDSKPKKAALAPVLRGVVKLKESRLLWTGSWAMSKEKFEQGERSKFKYFYAGSLGDLNPSSPPSGKYNGFFTVKNEGGAPPTKVTEKGIALKFGSEDDKGFLSVTGHGKNAFGDFTLSGMFHPSSGKMSLVKTYATPDDAFVDDDQQDEEDWDLIDDDPADTAAELADLKADAQEDIESVRKRILESEARDRAKKKGKVSS